MSKTITIIGLDCAKTVVQIHGSDETGHPLLKKRWRRAQVVPFFLL